MEDDSFIIPNPTPCNLSYIPDLGKHIKGSTNFFIFDSAEGSIAAIIVLPSGKLSLSDISDCVSKKHKGVVLELVQGGKQD